MYINTEGSINSLVIHALHETLPDGSAEDVTIGSKNAVTRELHPAYLCLTNPLNRVLTLKERKADIRATVGEMIWVLNGSSEIKYLSHYLPRAVDFSDDGIIWRAGYSERIFNFKSSKDISPINQFNYVKEALMYDITSRQAVISLWDPNREPNAFFNGGTKDYPCSNHIQFLVRNGKLDCTLTIRSNDILWGFSHINCFEFTILQEILAKELNVELGKYYHHACSFHLYERHFKRRDNILKSNSLNDVNNLWIPSLHDTNFELFFNHLIDPSKQTLKHLFDRYQPYQSSTELCWVFCLLFAFPNLEEGKKFGFNYIRSANLETEFDYFCRTVYGKALAYTLRLEDEKALLKNIK